MSSAAEILVIILSIFLAFFLVLGIVLIIYLIVLTNKIRKVTQSAERTVGTIETAVTNCTRIISPVFMAQMFKTIFNKRKSTKKNKEDK